MQNIEINQNEIQEIGTVRRVLPQVRNQEKPNLWYFVLFFSFDAIKLLHTKTVCLNCTADYRDNGKKFRYFQFGSIFSITINCNTIVNWPQ